MARVRIDYPRADREGWRRFIPSWKLVLGTLGTLMAVGAVVLTAVFAWAWLRIEIPEENDVAAAQTSIIYWNNGRTEMARLGDTNRISVPIEDIPIEMQHAVVAAEDRRFYEHSGFDVRTYQSVLKGTKFGPMILPGKPDESSLVALVDGQAKIRMPYNHKPLPNCLRQNIWSWIFQGAKNN